MSVNCTHDECQNSFECLDAVLLDDGRTECSASTWHVFKCHAKRVSDIWPKYMDWTKRTMKALGPHAMGVEHPILQSLRDRLFMDHCLGRMFERRGELNDGRR